MYGSEERRGEEKERGGKERRRRGGKERGAVAFHLGPMDRANSTLYVHKTAIQNTIIGASWQKHEQFQGLINVL